MRVSEALHEHFGRPLTESIGRLGHRRKSRMERCSPGEIIEPDDGHILWTPEALSDQGMHTTDRDQIVRSKDRGWPQILRQESGGPHSRRLDVGPTFRHVFGLDSNAGVVKRPAIPFYPFHDSTRLEAGDHNSDPAVTVVDQMAHRLVGRIDVIHHGRINLYAGEPAIDETDRDAGGE